MIKKSEKSFQSFFSLALSSEITVSLLFDVPEQPQEDKNRWLIPSDQSIDKIFTFDFATSVKLTEELRVTN